METIMLKFLTSFSSEVRAMSYSPRKKLVLRLGFILAALLFASARASADDIAPPDQPGPYHVGVTTFSAVMTGGRVTRVQVFYPTSEVPDQNFRYTINTLAGNYQLHSALRAAEDA